MRLGCFFLTLIYIAIIKLNLSSSHRQVQCNVLKAWRAFVPLSKEERERERRKAELRRKVASWLDDYQPSAGPPDVNNIEQ